jgi:hypothetical protein
MKYIGMILLPILLMMAGCEDNSESEISTKFTDSNIQGTYQIDDANSDMSFKLLINEDHTGSITDEYEEEITWLIKDDVLVVTIPAIGEVYYFDLVEGNLNTGEFNIQIDYENDTEIDEELNGRFVRIDDENNPDEDEGEGDVITPNIPGNQFLVDVERLRFILTLNPDSTGSLKGYLNGVENGIPFTWVVEDGVYKATTTDESDFYGVQNYHFYFESGNFNDGSIALTFDYVDEKHDDVTYAGSQIRDINTLFSYDNLFNNQFVVSSDDDNHPELTYIFTDEIIEAEDSYYKATDNMGGLHYWGVTDLTSIIIFKVDQSTPDNPSIDSITNLSLTAGNVQQGSVSVAITGDTLNNYDTFYTASIESTDP